MSEREIFEGWVVLELMGHRKLAGYVKMKSGRRSSDDRTPDHI